MSYQFTAKGKTRSSHVPREVLIHSNGTGHPDLWLRSSSDTREFILAAISQISQHTGKTEPTP